MGTFNRYVTLLGVREVVGFVTKPHEKKGGGGGISFTVTHNGN